MVELDNLAAELAIREADREAGSAALLGQIEFDAGGVFVRLEQLDALIGRAIPVRLAELREQWEAARATNPAPDPVAGEPEPVPDYAGDPVLARLVAFQGWIAGARNAAVPLVAVG